MDECRYGLIEYRNSEIDGCREDGWIEYRNLEIYGFR